jgi:hypothetical protein
LKELDGETSFDTKQRKKLRNVWITGRQGLTEREAASLLISDARSFLQKELGLANAKWVNQDSDRTDNDSQLLSEQSMHSSKEQSPLHDTTSKHSEETANQSPILCQLQAHPLLLEEELQSKIARSESNKRRTKHERKNSLRCSLPRNKTADLKDGIGKTDTKCLSSEVSDDDCVSSSPSLSCSQDKSSHRHTSRKVPSKLGKSRNSKMISGRIPQNTSVKGNTGKSPKNILPKISKTTASKLHKVVPIITNQFQCNRPDNTHSRRVNYSSSEESRCEQNLLSFSSMLHKMSDDNLPGIHSESNKSSSEVNQSTDYFGSPLGLSESKLYEETKQLKQNNKPEARNEPSPENVSDKVTSTSNVVNNKEPCLRTSVSSLRITNNTLNKNNEQSANVHGTIICLSDNQENGLLEKDAFHVDQMILNQNINPSLGPLCEKLEEKEKVTLIQTDNKRRSSDFFSSPVSVGKHALDIEGDIKSQSLFGDSLVMDTQLNNMLDACYMEHQKTAEGDYKNHAHDCDQKSFSNQIQQVPHDTRSTRAGEVNFHEAEVNDKICCSAQEVMKRQNNRSEMLDETISSAAYHPEMEDMEFPAVPNNGRDSKWRKGMTFHLSTENEISGTRSIYSEKTDFLSVDEQTIVSHVKSNFKTKKGLVSPVIYHLNENLHKSNRTSKETQRKKRKPSTSGDSSYSEYEFSNQKRKRISNGRKLPADDDEINCEKMVFSVFKDNDNAEHWLYTKNMSTSEHNKNLPTKGQTPDKHEQFPNKNHGLIQVNEQNLYIEKQTVRERPSPEDDHITDSFLKTAFDTYWDLDTENAETKKEDKLQHDFRVQGVSISIRKTSPLQELHALIPPSVLNITQKSNEPETKDEVIAADCASTSQRFGVETQGGSTANQSHLVISNSLLEAAFNTCLEENSDHKEIKREVAQKKQNVSNDVGCNLSLKDVNAHNNLGHQDNTGSVAQSFSKGEKMTGCSRRSPRLMAATADKENRNSHGKSIEVCKTVVIMKSE